MKSFENIFENINEDLSDKLNAARSEVISLIGPNPKKPNKEAMLIEINKMDNEIAIYLLYESLNSRTVLGAIFNTQRGQWKPNLDSGIYIDIKQSLSYRLHSATDKQIQVTKPILSPSLLEGLKNSFTNNQFNLINNAINKIDFNIIYSKIALLEKLIGKNGFIKIPKFNGKDAFNIKADLSRYFPGWLNFDYITKIKIVDILNNEKLKTFSVRSIPEDNNNYIVDINPFTKVRSDGSISPTGNVFYGSIAKALSLALIIPQDIPSKNWEINDAILQKKNEPNAKIQTQKDEITALQRTGGLLFTTTKMQESTGETSIHTFKKLSYGIKANDYDNLKEMGKYLSGASEVSKIKFYTNFVLSFINEHLFLHKNGVYFDDVATRNILLCKSGLINLIDYAGLDVKQDDKSILHNIKDTLYDIRFNLGLIDDKTSKKFYESISDILSNTNNLEQAKIEVIESLKQAFNKYNKEISESVNYTENEFINKLHSSESTALKRQ